MNRIPTTVETQRESGARIHELCKLNEFDRARERYETQKANRARYFQKKANKQG